MDLFSLLLGISFEVTHGRLRVDAVEDVVSRPEDVRPNTLFVCLPERSSAGDFDKACDRGASIIVTERLVRTNRDITVLKVEDAHYTLSLLAANFFGRPCDRLTVIGVTGTKGKTTTASMLHKLLLNVGKHCGLIGSLGFFYEGKRFEMDHDTRTPYGLQRLLLEMTDRGMDTVVMEVSSKQLRESTVAGIHFDISVLTNISPNHLQEEDFTDFADYVRCKGRLFERCDRAVVNGDDRYIQDVLANKSCDIFRYGLTADVDFRADNVEIIDDLAHPGLAYDIYNQGRIHIEIHKLGRSNVYNSLAAYAVLHTMGYDITENADDLNDIVIDGRAEIIKNDCGIGIVVDCAKTPLEFQQLFEMIEEYRNNRILSVFGAVGNVRQGLRRALAKTAAVSSEICFLTEHDYGTEPPDAITEEMATYLQETGTAFEVIPDRALAIRTAIATAEAGDIVVILGKGPEHTLLRGTQAVAYSEYDAIYEALRERKDERHVRSDHH
ncbi:MAG: UDP-N-acetylmuramyl-tripeptide synthetase [Eubacteriales bacterium]|nr:UDP-N-acetylmuramyl-tripeptide synthetase [Eubacteriales bacterium]